MPLQNAIYNARGNSMALWLLTIDILVPEDSDCG